MSPRVRREDTRRRRGRRNEVVGIRLGASARTTVAPLCACPICQDVRQYVPAGGQRWIDPLELASRHANRVERHEAALYGVGTTPSFAIGQRALLSGDVLQVVPERSIVSFMYSYPNQLPLPAATVRRGRDRYLAALEGRLPGQDGPRG